MVGGLLVSTSDIQLHEMKIIHNRDSFIGSCQVEARPLHRLVPDMGAEPPCRYGAGCSQTSPGLLQF
jgi:hypothetical protein